MTQRSSWYERLGYNPLVLRAFRTGFRSGRGNFRIGIWSILLVVVLGIVGMMLYGEAQRRGSVPIPKAAAQILIALLWYISSVFVFGGIQRMLVSVSGERERGTFDFLHLSTLPPRAIIWGLMLAGHLPGYLLLTVLAPIIFVAGWFAEWQLAYLFLFLVELVGLVVFASLSFQLVGYWTKKATDLRTLALLLFLLAIVVLSAMSQVLPALKIVAFYPVLQSTLYRAAGAEGFDLLFYGMVVPLEVLVAAFFIPVGVLCYRSLARCLRYRERKPVTTLAGLSLVVWLQVFLLGCLWQDAHYVTLYSVLLSWLVGGFLLRVSTRSNESLSRYVWLVQHKQPHDSNDAPAYWLQLGLGLSLLGAGLAPMFSSGYQGAAWSALCAFVPAALPFLYQQWLQVRGLRGAERYLGAGWAIVMVWAPLVAGLIMRAFDSQYVDLVLCCSPLGQVLVFDGNLALPPMSSATMAVAVTVQGVYFVALVLLIALNYRGWRALQAQVVAADDPGDAAELPPSVTDTTSQFAETTVIRPEDQTPT
ncbi:MAG: hypothetical protein AAF581_03510 [Planctomycetota bacterium]